MSGLRTDPSRGFERRNICGSLSDGRSRSCRWGAACSRTAPAASVAGGNVPGERTRTPGEVRGDIRVVPAIAVETGAPGHAAVAGAVRPGHAVSEDLECAGKGLRSGLVEADAKDPWLLGLQTLSGNPDCPRQGAQNCSTAPSLPEFPTSRPCRRRARNRNGREAQRVILDE